MPDNPLAGMPLDYLIGKKDIPLGTVGRITEVAYDVDEIPQFGPIIGYCNARTEDGEAPEYGPYLPHDDIFEKYGEGKPNPAHPGWERNIRDQCERRKRSGTKFVEFDNLDSYSVVEALRIAFITQDYGLGLLGKNVALLGDGADKVLGHANVFGCIVESDSGLPDDMEAMRRKAGKPELPMWFVFFGSNRAAALACAEAIGRARYINMGVTYSAQGEYESSEDILVPIKAEAMTWRVAKSLLTLRDQIDALAPGRDKSSDGTISDEQHQGKKSDHNPDGEGLVRALDITHDPAHQVDTYALAEIFRRNRDPRIKYVISNGRIFSSLISPWIWRPYTGSNPHDKHVHVSVVADDVRADDPSPWQLELEPGGRQPPQNKLFTSIIATVFGGSADYQLSAYDEHRITDTELGVALPYRFPGTRPTVRVHANGRFVDCAIVDVGPWNADDPYWLTGSRPQAESGTDKRGRPTNRAGIDLTPAAARAIEIDGKGYVHWQFSEGSMTDQPTNPVTIYPPETNFAKLIADAVMQAVIADIKAHPEKIAAILGGLVGGMPPVQSGPQPSSQPAKPIPQPQPAPSQPMMPKWGFGTGILGTILATILNQQGVTAPPIGEASTLVSLLSFVAPIALSVFGAGGGVAGMIAKLAPAVFAALTGKK